MTIKFVCSCGKHLRARDHLAARRLACPRCGAPIGVPGSAQPFVDPQALPSKSAPKISDPNEPGWEPNEAAARAAAELSERFRKLGQEEFSKQVASSSRSKRARLASRLSRFRQTWDPGTRWFHCLVFPAAAWGRMVLLGMAVGIFALAIPLQVQRLLIPDGSDAVSHLAAICALSIASVALMAQVCAWFVCVLSAERGGELTVTSLSLRRVDLAARGLAIVAATFAGGPLFLAVVGLWFWLHSGRLTPIDLFILGELILVVAGYWTFALAEACLSRWPRPANPARVAEMIGQLGWRTIVIAGLAWFEALLFLLFVARAVRPIEKGAEALPVFGLAILLLMYGSIVLRLAGMWCRQAEELAQLGEVDSTPFPTD